MVRDKFSVPVSDGWNRTPQLSIQGVTRDDCRMVIRASFSSVSPPVTRSRSSQYSSSRYDSVSTEVGPSCIARRLRVCRLLPPRNTCGACSSTITEAPVSRAVIAAHNAALPPPMTATS